MSFEGYDQILCENGHYHTHDCYNYTDFNAWTCFCGAKCAWYNTVDETNGTHDPDTGERIDDYVELEEVEPCLDTTRKALAEKTQAQLQSLPVGVLSTEVKHFLDELVRPFLLPTYKGDQKEPRVFKIPADKGYRIDNNGNTH